MNKIEDRVPTINGGAISDGASREGFSEEEAVTDFLGKFSWTPQTSFYVV